MQDIQIILLNVFVQVLILLMMAFVIGYIVYLYTQKQAALKLNFNAELHTAKLEIKEQLSLHISQELHDNINGYLSLAKLNLNTSIPFLCEKTREKAEDTLHLLDYSLESIRSISRSLNHEHMAFESLPDMLEKYIGWITKSHYQVSFTISGDYYNLSKEKELMLFRILQETISNIVRHSKADKIDLSLVYAKEHLKCTISDNGIGFDVKEKLSNGNISGSLGLQNIYRRVKMINATCDIKSNQQTGTIICITTLLK